MKGFSLRPEDYIKQACEWIGNGREDIYSAVSYERKLRKASRNISEKLNLEDRRVYEHVTHWLMMGCGMKYNACLDTKDGKNVSTVDFRGFKPERIEAEVEQYLEHIDARYKVAWERENPGKPLPKLPIVNPASSPLSGLEPELVQLTA